MYTRNYAVKEMSIVRVANGWILSLPPAGTNDMIAEGLKALPNLLRIQDQNANLGLPNGVHLEDSVYQPIMGRVQDNDVYVFATFDELMKFLGNLENKPE